MALILKSDTTMDTVPAGTPTLPPPMRILASDSLSGPIGPLHGRTLPNDLGGSASLVWDGVQYEITESGGAETTHTSNRLVVTPGVADVVGEVTITDLQSGVSLTLNARNEALWPTGRRIRLSIEPSKIVLTEVNDGTTPVERAQHAHTLTAGDSVALAVRGQSPVQASVWVNGDPVIPWTTMEHSYTGENFSIVSGAVRPSFVINDFMLHEII